MDIHVLSAVCQGLYVRVCVSVHLQTTQTGAPVTNRFKGRGEVRKKRKWTRDLWGRMLRCQKMTQSHSYAGTHSPPNQGFFMYITECNMISQHDDRADYYSTKDTVWKAMLQSEIWWWTCMENVDWADFPLISTCRSRLIACLNWTP